MARPWACRPRPSSGACPAPTGSTPSSSGCTRARTARRWISSPACKAAGQPDAHRMLLANCLAQRQALLRGKSLEQALLDVAHIDDRARAAPGAAHGASRRASFLADRAAQARPAWPGALLACTSTRYSCRAWSGASIPSTNGAWSWAAAGHRHRARAGGAGVGGRGRPGHDASTSYWIDCYRATPSAAAAPCLGAGRRGASVSGARGQRPRGRPLPHNPYAVSGIP